MIKTQQKRRWFVPSLIAGLAVLGLTACAATPPDVTGTLVPGRIGSLEAAAGVAASGIPSPSGSKLPGSEEGGDGLLAVDDPSLLEGIEGRQPVEVEKSNTLPESFPIDVFPIPDGAAIVDAGERSSDAWFVVLSESSLGSARVLLDEFARAATFTVAESNQTATTIEETQTGSGSTACQITGFAENDSSASAFLINFECSL